MRLIVKKVLRTMWTAKKAYAACISIILIGTLSSASLSNVYQSLLTSLNNFYGDYNFADAFAVVKQMPRSRAEALQDIEGVKKAEGRLSVNARVIKTGEDKIITLHLLGADFENDSINNFYVEGSVISDSRDILIGKPFIAAHGLSEGDQLELSIGGARYYFTLRGAVQSPEYVYTMPDSGGLMPDPYTYDIGVVGRDTLENITGQRGFVNEIGILLEEGYAFEDVKVFISDRLKDYVLISLVPRKDQTSNTIMQGELSQLGGMSGNLSALFMIVAAAIMYIMLRRLVEQERTQIGVLKAFGFGNGAILMTYTLYGVIAGAIGGILGGILGIYAAESMFGLYREYFNIPNLELQASNKYLLRGIVVAVATGIISALLGVRGVLGLKPSDAMRPVAPPLIKKSIVDGSGLFKAVLTRRGMMSLRYIERNKLKSFLIVFSISLSFVLMSMMFSYNFLADKTMGDLFNKIETYDISINLKSFSKKHRAEADMRNMEGVISAEGIIEMPFEMSHMNINRNVVFYGLNPESTMFKIMDEYGRYYEPPTDGFLITKGTADKMGIAAGDTVTLDNPYLNEKKHITVKGVFKNSFGSGCYMDGGALSALMGYEPITNRIILKAEPESFGSIKDKLTEGANVSAVNDITTIISTYEEMMSSYIYLIYVILIMSIAIAFAVIYNISGVSLSERQRELATMRVLGYTPKDANDILAFENYILCVFAIIVGIPLSIFSMNAMGASMDNDVYSLPSYLPYSSYVFASGGCLISVFLANMATLRSIRNFELVEVLKERE